MGQENVATRHGAVFLASGDGGLLGPELRKAGWTSSASDTTVPTASAYRDSGAAIAIVDLRLSGTMPPHLAELADMVARRGGALVALGSADLLAAALAIGATHVAVDPTGEAVALVMASAACHVDRLDRLSADRGTAPGGWDGPGDAMARIEAALVRSPEPLILLVALERFDVVNAAYGRAVGDQVLDSAALRIGRVARELSGPDALVARVAGSEFVVVPGGSSGDADRSGDDGGTTLASRIAARLSEPFVVIGAPVSVDHHIAADTPRPGETGAAVLDRLRAEVTLARVDAGATGTDTPEALAIDLHRAIERGEIELLFQPQVSLADDRIVGVEALARWAHPRLGTLGAEPLLVAAARAGLGHSLSAHIQALALRRAAAWRGASAALRLSINITAQDLAAAGFADRFLSRLAASGFPAARLTVEVTETGLILDLEAAATALAGLRDAGCRVALDDFGTGYSSLAYLKALPVDYLKIDKAISRDVTGSSRDRAVLAGVIDIARALGLGTIAEGVETVEERDRLAAMGCDIYQGYLCAEPIDERALADLLASR
ncbi:MAG: EAL domain-containing protein [Janthinobacterium lividum]